MNKIIFFVLQFFILASLSFGTDRYVRCVTGSNSNNGLSLATAFLTMQKCADVSSSGDNCFVSDNEVCTTGWSTETGFTKNNLDFAFTVSGIEDGGSGEIDFPDQRPNITGVAVFNLSGLTDQFAGLNARDNVFSYKKLKITIPNTTFGMYSGGYASWKDCEINDTGLTGEKGFLFMQYSQNYFDNVFFNKMNTRYYTFYYEANGGTQQVLKNNYFRWGQFDISMTIGKYANSSPDTLQGNVFEVTNAHSTTYPIISVHGGTYNEVENNTFIGNGIPNLKAIKVWEMGYGAPLISVKNNLFYEFDGAGSTSLTWNSGVDFNIMEYGNNGYFNSTAPEAISSRHSIATDLTANDVVIAEDPFIDFAGGNLKLKPDYRGTATDDKDIGAIQSEPNASGSGSTIFTQ